MGVINISCTNLHGVQLNGINNLDYEAACIPAAGNNKGPPHLPIRPWKAFRGNFLAVSVFNAGVVFTQLSNIYRVEAFCINRGGL